MMKQDGKLNVINQTLNKVFGQRRAVFKKFAETSKNFASNLNSKLIVYMTYYICILLYKLYPAYIYIYIYIYPVI